MSNKASSPSNLNEEVYKSAKSLYDINVGILTQLAEQQLAYGSLFTDYATRQMELLGTTRNYKELMLAEGKAVKEFAVNAQAIASGTLNILTESKDDVAAWVEKGIEKTASAVAGRSAAA